MRGRIRPAAFVFLLFLWICVALSAGCGERGPRTLDEIRESGELVVLTRNAPTTYYEGRDTLEGVEYEMATSFARYLGVKARFEVKRSIEEIIDALLEGKGDLAAAGLTRTPARADTFLFGPVYQRVTQQVVTHREVARPHEVKDLIGLDLRVVAGSSYAAHLERLREEYPELEWTEVRKGGTEALLEQVWRQEIDATVADDNIVSVNRRYFPELYVGFDISDEEEIAWAMPHTADSLRAAVEAWFEAFEDRRLDELMEKYYGYVESFEWVDTREFLRRIETRLPTYRRLFESAGDQYGVRWTLLAAMAYQESHWRPKATSPTGVKGIMMLTLAAADDVGVENRLDPGQSVRGGARYFADIRDRLPDGLVEPDRSWAALAAYNVGMGHLYDARRLALRRGLNPDYWSVLVEMLPLLSKKEFYLTVPHGYARGWEPVLYVQRIRHYEDVLLEKLGMRR